MAIANPYEATFQLTTGGVDIITVHAYTAQDATMQALVEAAARHGADGAVLIRLAPPESCWSVAEMVGRQISDAIVGALGKGRGK